MHYTNDNGAIVYLMGKREAAALLMSCSRDATRSALNSIALTADGRAVTAVFTKPASRSTVSIE